VTGRITSQRGFTVVELLLAMTVAGIMISVLFSITFNYYANAVQSQAAANMALESQTILSQIVDDLRLADGTGASTTLTDTYAPPGNWTTSDTNDVLIIKSPATTSTEDIIYRTDTGYPYHNEYVYFVKGKTLYKRILKNSSATDNAANQTCPAVNATATCRADLVYSTDLTSFTFTLYDTNNVVTTVAGATRSVKLSITLSKLVFGKTITLSNTTQVTQRNQ
jgi:prepilin-type N-terminal cleavage/methylation domain-containing protein